MSFYQVNNASLRTGRDELLNLNERLRGEKENLNSYEMQLKNMWEGEANEQFHNTFVKSASQMDAFYQLMGRYCEVIEAIAARYDMAEQRNLSTAGRKIY